MQNCGPSKFVSTTKGHVTDMSLGGGDKFSVQADVRLAQ